MVKMFSEDVMSKINSGVDSEMLHLEKSFDVIINNFSEESLSLIKIAFETFLLDKKMNMALHRFIDACTDKGNYVSKDILDMDLAYISRFLNCSETFTIREISDKDHLNVIALFNTMKLIIEKSASKLKI